MHTYIRMPAETRKDVSHKTIEFGLTAHPLLQALEDALVGLQQHLQLGGDEEAEISRGNHMLEGRKEHRQDSIEVVNILALCGDEFIDDHVPLTWEQ